MPDLPNGYDSQFEKSVQVTRNKDHTFTATVKCLVAGVPFVGVASVQYTLTAGEDATIARAIHDARSIVAASMKA